MAKVELKKPIVEEIAGNVKDAQSVVLVDYRGLTVEHLYIPASLFRASARSDITCSVRASSESNFRMGRW